MKTIVITGTKGKTTVSRMLHDFIVYKGTNSFLVDSTGSYVNQKQLSTKKDSLMTYNYNSPNVTPGRYIKFFKKRYPLQLEDSLVVLESSYSSHSNLGVDDFEYGILTNIYKDHINGQDIKTEEDILRLKSFVYKNLNVSGTYFTNIDNKFTFSTIADIDEQKELILFSAQKDNSNFDELLSNPRVKSIYSIDEDNIIRLYSKSNKQELLSLTGIKLLDNKLDNPIVESMLIVLSFVHNYFGDIQSLKDFFSTYELPEDYQTLRLYKSQNNLIWLDKAHQVDVFISALKSIQDDMNLLPNFQVSIKIPLNFNLENSITMLDFIAQNKSIKKINIYRKYEYSQEESSSIEQFEDIIKTRYSSLDYEIWDSEEEVVRNLVNNEVSFFHNYYDLDIVKEILKENNFN